MSRSIMRCVIVVALLIGALPSIARANIPRAIIARGGVEHPTSHAVVDVKRAGSVRLAPKEPEAAEIEPAPFRGHPVPDWALGLATPEPNAARGSSRASPDPQPNAAILANDFLGLADNNTSIPPDTQGAVGPSHVMTTLNSQIRIQDRAGATLSTVVTDAFWSGLGSPNTFDPRVMYDPYNNRWIFVMAADGALASSSILLGASQSSDPTGSWNLYRFDADSGNTTWADFPTVGFNKDLIVVNVNMFSNTGGNWAGGTTFVFSKADAYAGVAAGSFHSSRINDTEDFTLVPATTFDNSTATLYLLEDWNGNGSGSGWLKLKKITGSASAPTLTDLGMISTPNPWSDQPAGGLDSAAQLGSPHTVNNGDARMQTLAYRNGSLWAAQSVFLPANAPTHTAVQWWEIAPVGPSIMQRARIEDATGATSFAFPSLAVNANDDVLIGYSRFSATQYPSANYSFRFGADPPNTLGADTVLKAGVAPYYKTFAGPSNRWGDYSAAVVDPTDDFTMWTLQEYADTPSGGYDRWGTWWAKVAPTTSAAIYFSTSNYWTSEASGSKSITVSRAGDTTGSVGVSYATANGAAHGSDYTPVAGTLTFDAGITSQTFSVPVTNDTTPEPNETVNLSLSAPTGGAILGSLHDATLTIGDDDPVRRRPDGLIKIAGETNYIGNNRYNSSGAGQTKAARVARGGHKTFYALFANDGNSVDSYAIKAPVSSAGFTVKYYLVNGTSLVPISASSIAAGTYTLSSIPAGSYRVLRADVIVATSAAHGARKTLGIFGISKNATSIKDAVVAIVDVA